MGWPAPTGLEISIRGRGEPRTIELMNALPGAELVAKGLADLARGEETIESLVVAIGAPKLRSLGLDWWTGL